MALRLYLLLGSQVIIEADEALVGLQAFDILRGERPIFYPGQAYGGSLESYLVAAVFRLLGASPLTLKLIPFLFSTLFIFMTYQLAKEIYNPPIGLLSALFVALCPVLLTAFSLKTWGGYSQTPVLGNLALILLQRILSRRAQDEGLWKATLGLGFLSGLGLWVNPQYFYYLGPVVLLLLARAKRVGLIGLAAFAVGCPLGGLPLLLANLSRSQDAMGNLILEGVVPARDFWYSFKAAVSYFFTDALPTLWGLRPIKGELAITPAFVVIPLYLAAMLICLWLVGRDLLARRYNPAIVLAATLILAPFVFILAALTNGNWMVIIPDSGILARYLMPLYSVVPILLAAFIWRLRSFSRPLALALVALVLTVNLWSNLSVDPVNTMRCVFENVPLPASDKALIDFLDSESVRYVYTNHWIGFRLMFETQKRVITFDYPDSLYGMDRLPQYGHQVEAAEVPPAYILFNPGWKQTPPLEKEFQKLGVHYEKKAFPPLEYIVYYRLSRKVHPSEVIETLVWPYY
jgi:4-amino-4-deoxy-L-arabinose transferase-like glycosyltransferase